MRMNDRYTLEQNVRERGRRDRVMDNPHATDEQLWSLGTAILPEEFGTWAEWQAAIAEDPALSTSSAGADSLMEMREWYDEDRRSNEVDMEQLAKALGLLAVPASVVYDCGGQWLLHVGPMFTDAEGVEVPAVTFGGDMTTPDQSSGTVWCSTDGMSVGTGDRSLPDAEQIQESIEEKPWRVADLAELISKVLDRELERRGYDAAAWAEHEKVLADRVDNAVAAAENAFWSAVAVRFPEVTSGDVDPGLAMSLEQLMKRAVADLVDCNGPQMVPWAAGTTEPVILEPDTSCGNCGAADKTACDCATAAATVDITRDQLEAWAGRQLTADDVARIDEAIPNSSIPDAIGMIVDGMDAEDNG